ncbi:MAG: M18 family aminopeptidase, partial [Nitrospinae bacterium]|nr:M18 family aminopeptidase [Nitrospinota bacterium]
MNQQTRTNRIQNMLDFINRSPTPFHAVEEMSNTLAEKGFTRLQEEDAWELETNGRYFLTRNDSSLIAFVVGSKPSFKIIGAHTDSPNLRLKPNAGYDKNGYLQLGVEVYGGVLLSTWTDRDLSLAGRVILAGKKKPL